MASRSRPYSELIRTYGISTWGTGLARLDVGCADHLAPLLDFVCEELAEFGRCHRHRNAARSVTCALILGSARPAVGAAWPAVRPREPAGRPVATIHKASACGFRRPT